MNIKQPITIPATMLFTLRTKRKELTVDALNIGCVQVKNNVTLTGECGRYSVHYKGKVITFPTIEPARRFFNKVSQ